jgi:NHL repeat
MGMRLAKWRAPHEVQLKARFMVASLPPLQARRIVTEHDRKDPTMRRLILIISSLAALLVATPAQATPELTGTFGGQGSEPGKLNEPWALAHDSAGRIYVTEPRNQRVSVFDSAGKFIRTIGSGFKFPSGVAVAGDTIYVTDRDNHRIRRFDRTTGIETGDIGTSLPGVPAAPSTVWSPNGIAVGGGNLYVTSAGHERVQRFDLGGNFQGSAGGQGAAPGQDVGAGALKGIAGIAVSGGGVYVADSQNRRIQRFHTNLAFYSMFGRYGTGLGQFILPQAVAADYDTKDVFVADRIAATVQQFDADGHVREVIGKGSLNDPAGMTVDCRGTLYVADRQEHRIKKFGPKQSETAGNLLKNPGFEAGGASCWHDSGGPVPGWTHSEGATAVHYGASGSLGRELGDNVKGGESFVAGGAGQAESTLTQTVDVSGQARDIDEGRRLASLSGLLGGYEKQADAATVEASFRDRAGKEIGKLQIGPVSADDRSYNTTLLPRNAKGTVPTGTRAIQVRVTLKRVGTAPKYNDAYADSLALTLTPQPRKPVGPKGGPGGGSSGSGKAAPRVTLKWTKNARALRSRQVALRASCDKPCGLAIRAGGHVRRSARLQVGSKAQRVTLKVSKIFARKARQRMYGKRPMKLHVRVQATDRAGNAVTVTKKVPIKR